MGWIAESWRRVRTIGRRTGVERRLAEEVQFHVDQQTEKNRRAGMTSVQARRQALVAFGGVESVKEHARDEFRPATSEDVLRDLRYGIRMWRRTPGFTLVAVLTMALGIGATTAVFTVVHGVLIKPLPYPEADRLVELVHLAPGLDLPGGTVNIAATQLFTYREQNRVFQDIGIWQLGSAAVTGGADPEQVRMLIVTHGTLEALAVRPGLGRGFSPEDDAPGSPETVVLAHGYWRRHFGGEATVIGRSLTVDGRPRQIIGVMPPDFVFLARGSDLIVPFRFDPNRLRLGQFNYRGLARLKPGVTLAEANEDVGRMIPGWLRAWPAPPGLDPKLFESARLTPALRPLKEFVVGNIGRVLWVLMGAVALVLLIACANVANLLLVRAEGRQHELAIRSALGAGRRRIVRGLLLETAVLCLTGGALGLALAAAGVRLFVNAIGDNVPRAADIGVDPAVVTFTLVISVLSGLVAGLVTAIRRSSPDIARELAGSGRTSSQSRERRRARNTLIVVQVSLATVLLVASGLMIRSFVALGHVPPGFTDADHVQLLRLTIPGAQAPEPDGVFRMQCDIRDRLAAIPGVVSASFASATPMQPANSGDPLSLEHHTYAAGQVPPFRPFRYVAPGYFQTLGAPLVAGRDIAWSDIQSERPVAIVVESLAREGWGSATAAIGGRVREFPTSPWREVIGVVADIRDNGLHVPAPSTVYWPARMTNFSTEAIRVNRSMTFVIRSERAGTESLRADIREAVRAVNGSLPVADVRTLDELYEGSLAQTSVTLLLLAVAATMALLLSLVGIYGVLSYAVAQRTREIGIRVALGARRTSLRMMFLGDGLRLSAIGIAGGLLVAGVLTQTMTALLFGVSAFDPMTYLAVAVVLTASAAGASYVPVHRATAVPPIEVLRAP